MNPSCHAAVVIPTHDNASEIRRAVAGAIASGRAAVADFGLDLRLDVVLADDASTDASPQIALELAAAEMPPGVTILAARNPVNRGAGPTRNLGVAQSDAKFVFFLDADDEFLPPHIGLCLTALLADPAAGYVWTRRDWDIPVHESWRDRLDESSVMNLCVRRAWHDICRGFPEHPDFRGHGYEDCYYRAVLRRIARGRFVAETTTRVHVRPGNAQERQMAKFASPFVEWRDEWDDRQPTPAMVADLEDRLAYVQRVREEFLG